MKFIMSYIFTRKKECGWDIFLYSSISVSSITGCQEVNSLLCTALVTLIATFCFYLDNRAIGRSSIRHCMVHFVPLSLVGWVFRPEQDNDLLAMMNLLNYSSLNLLPN